MAREGEPRGLRIGQVVTLTFSFLVASVFIFGLGLWVGYDLAAQQFARKRAAVEVALPPLPGATPTAGMAAEVFPGGFRGRLPTPTPLRLLSVPTRPPAEPSRARPSLTRTVTSSPIPATPTPPPTVTPTATAGKHWTVQVGATTDAVQAAMLAHRLRQRGFEAKTVPTYIRGVPWYLVRVGRFQRHRDANDMARRLRVQEGFEAAYVTPE